MEKAHLNREVHSCVILRHTDSQRYLDFLQRCWKTARQAQKPYSPGSKGGTLVWPVLAQVSLQPLQGLLRDPNHQQTWGWHLLNQILWPLTERLMRGPLRCKTSVPAAKKGMTDFRRNAPRTVRCCSSRDRAKIPYGSADRSLGRIFMDTLMMALAALEDRCWGWLNKTSYLMTGISLKAQGIENYN